MSDIKRIASIKQVSFMRVDIRKDNCPMADLIICRDLLVHLSLDDCIKVIKNFADSGSKYLLLTNFLNVDQNIDIITGSWRPLNMELKPFFFTKPLDVILECRE